MSFLDLHEGILEEFASFRTNEVPRARKPADVGLPERVEDGGVEALRQAWRARQRVRGECRACRLPAIPGKSYCAGHRQKNIERALASKARRAA